MAEERPSKAGSVPRADQIGEKTSAPPEQEPGGLKVGTIIARRYEVKGFLGRGGMGLVYKAVDMELGEEVAIKLLQAEYTRELSEIERLKREIVTARKITHPNVIRLHDFGLDEKDEGFISMEVLSGGSLSDKLEKAPNGKMDIREALDIAIGCCDGLAAAHDKGIIHRDIKPENVLFDEDGTPKLLDFGLARSATTQNTVWAITGTPRYMSPEQSEGEPATPRSDVYSMGVMLFLLFTGRLPFLADNLLALATEHAEKPAPRLREIRADIPAKIEQIVLKCLEKNPSKRFASARSLTAEFRAVRESGDGMEVEVVSRASSPDARTMMLPNVGDDDGPTAKGMPSVKPIGSLDRAPSGRSPSGRRLPLGEDRSTERAPMRAIMDRDSETAPAPRFKEEEKTEAAAERPTARAADRLQPGERLTARAPSERRSRGGDPHDTTDPHPAARAPSERKSRGDSPAPVAPKEIDTEPRNRAARGSAPKPDRTMMMDSPPPVASGDGETIVGRNPFARAPEKAPDAPIGRYLAFGFAAIALFVIAYLVSMKL